MAFQQPQRHPQPRLAPVHQPSLQLPSQVNDQPAIARESRYTSQSEEWVLFSPHHTTHDGTESTQTPRTAGRSRVSEIGSLDTAAVSEPDKQDHAEIASEDDRGDAETEDLDSLDDGLHAFGDIRGVEASQTVLPAHDGLGMFQGSSGEVQDQIWQHERYNPRRRRSSLLRRDALQARNEEVEQQRDFQSAEDDRFQRIEKWRLEQSRAILDEIERETKRMRRRRRMAESRASQSNAGLSTIASSSAAPPKPVPEPSAAAPARRESLWERFKRHVIRDLMGLDDATLSYIFGEAIPVEAEEADATPQKMVEHAERTVRERHALVKNTDSWEEKLLARIAHELGFLIHQISEHPGAFSTYLRTQEPLPYAGFATPRASKVNLKAEADRARHPVFKPTLDGNVRPGTRDGSDPSIWGVEDEADHVESSQAAAQRKAAIESEQEKEYWERDLDIKMVFGFLRSRLTSSSSDSTPSRVTELDEPDPAACLVSTPASNPQTTTTSADSLRRAALIRHHHPLVSGKSSASSARPLAFTHQRKPSSLSAPLSPILGRRDSSVIDGAESCASQSTKKSKTRHSGSLGGSSRNYWDLGAGGSSAWGEA